MKRRLFFTITALLLLVVTSMASAYSRRATEKPAMARSENAGSSSALLSATKEVTPIDWDTSAAGFQGQTGKTFVFRCPADGSAKPIYGSDIYTDDSSICTAAVHVGLISVERGGAVTIEIRPGRSTYGSTTRHGIKSINFGEYGRSFIVLSSDVARDNSNRDGRISNRADSDDNGDNASRRSTGIRAPPASRAKKARPTRFAVRPMALRNPFTEATFILMIRPFAQRRCTRGSLASSAVA